MFVNLQDSLTAEDFAFSEGLPGNKNNYTLTYRCHRNSLSSFMVRSSFSINMTTMVIGQHVVGHHCFHPHSHHNCYFQRGRDKHHNRKDRICSNSCGIPSKQWAKYPYNNVFQKYPFKIPNTLPNSGQNNCHLMLDPWDLPNKEQNVLPKYQIVFQIEQKILPK